MRTERILQLVDAARPTIPAAGIVDVSPEEMSRALLMHNVVERPPVDGGWAWEAPYTLTWPDAAGVRYLRLRPDLDPVLKVCCRSLVLGAAFNADVRATAVERQVFAFVLAVPFCVADSQHEVLARRIALLDSQPTLWTMGLPGVYEAAGRVLYSLSGRANESGVMAAADADAACALAVQAREAGAYDDAELLFAEGLRRARDAAHWERWVYCKIGMGRMAWQRGLYKEARRLFRDAEEMAARHELRHMRARALHWQFSVEDDAGNTAAAARLAGEAFRAYRPGDARLLALVNDIGQFWMGQGYFRRALAVLMEVADRITEPAERMLVWANAARAAGGAGEPAIFRRATDRARQLMDGLACADRVATALLEIARGACSLGEWGMAETFGSRAIEVAAQRSETPVLAAARGVVASATTHRRLDRHSLEAGPVDDEALAGEIVAAVRRSGPFSPA